MHFELEFFNQICIRITYLVHQTIDLDSNFYETWQEKQKMHKFTTKDYFNYFQSQLQNQENREMFSSNVSTLLNGMVRNNLPHNLMNMVVHFVFSNAKILPTNSVTKCSEKVVVKVVSRRINKIYNTIHQNHPEEFITKDLIQELIEKNGIQPYLQSEIEKCKIKGNYMQTFKLIQSLGNDLELVKVYTFKVNPTKLASRFIVQSNMNILDFPLVEEGLLMDSLRYFIKVPNTTNQIYPWEKLELLVNRKHLPVLCKQYFQTNSDAAYSIARRNMIVFENEQLNEKVKWYSKDTKQNALLNRDSFNPTEMILYKSDEYISLERFNINEDNIVMIEKEDDLLDQYQKDIMESPLVGLDTESEQLIPSTRFSNLELSCIQIAIGNKIFILNVKVLKDSEQIRLFLSKLFQRDNPIIGQAIGNDIQEIFNVFNLKTTPKNLIDLGDLFLKLHQKEEDPTAKSSLAYQTEMMFAKKLSKIEQISQWSQRPLRKAQLHYAAMDAFICIKLYEIYKQM